MGYTLTKKFSGQFSGPSAVDAAGMYPAASTWEETGVGGVPMDIMVLAPPTSFTRFPPHTHLGPIFTHLLHPV